ncbi:MAG: hypothetical protein QG608_2 [Actinomycetota bacterium]|nr:hypothetical protein [Actinomycetota bacterium]
MHTHSRKSLRFGVVLAMAAAAIVGTASTSSAAVAKLTVSPSIGSNASGTVVTAVSTTANTFRTAAGTKLLKNTAGTLDADAVQLQKSTACSTTPVAETATVINAGNVTIASGTKAVVTLPALTAGAWVVCAYNADGSAVLGSGKYTAAAPPTVTGVTPSAGPVYGGSAVAVEGTNFSKTTTATLGGKALTGIKVATDGTSFTAVTPANAAGASALVVTASGGSVTSAGAFTYKDGLSVSPTTMVNNGTTVLDVTGYGFATLFDAAAIAKTDGTTPDNATAHVFLVKGNYDPTDATGVKTNPETAECNDVVVVSDTNLVCTLDATSVNNKGKLAGPILPEAAYSVVVVSDGAVAAQLGGTYRETIISSQSTFTIAPY